MLTVALSSAISLSLLSSLHEVARIALQEKKADAQSPTTSPASDYAEDSFPDDRHRHVPPCVAGWVLDSQGSLPFLERSERAPMPSNGSSNALKRGTFPAIEGFLPQAIALLGLIFVEISGRLAHFVCSTATLSSNTWPTIPRLLALILSNVSCGVCQYPAEFTRSITSAAGTPRSKNDRWSSSTGVV